MACLIGVSECSGDDCAKFGDVAHVYAPHSWIKGEAPAHGSVRLLLRSQNADQILVVHGRDDERMFWKSRFFDYQINLGLAGEVGNVELAATDRFHIRERGPDKVFDTCILGGAYRSARLLEFVRTLFPKIGD